MEIQQVYHQPTGHCELLHAGHPSVILRSHLRAGTNERAGGREGYCYAWQNAAFYFLFSAIRTGPPSLLRFLTVLKTKEHGHLLSAYRHLPQPRQINHPATIHAYLNERSLKLPLPQEQALISPHHQLNADLHLSRHPRDVHPPTAIGLQNQQIEAQKMRYLRLQQTVPLIHRQKLQLPYQLLPQHLELHRVLHLHPQQGQQQRSGRTTP